MCALLNGTTGLIPLFPGLLLGYPNPVGYSQIILALDRHCLNPQTNGVPLLIDAPLLGFVSTVGNYVVLKSPRLDLLPWEYQLVSELQDRLKIFLSQK